MRIFVSYSFRPENAWIEDYVLPLIGCFGHEAVTGRLLDAGPVPPTVRDTIKSCKKVLCFVTRATPTYSSGGQIVSYAPPDWVRDEHMIAQGSEVDVVEFRETSVVYGGAASFYAVHDFDRDKIPALLLHIAKLLRAWPVGPLQLRLTVPQEIDEEFRRGVRQGNFVAICTARHEDDSIISQETQPVRLRDRQFVVPFWIKPDPNIAIDVEIAYGPRKLVCKGVAPAICDALLEAVG